MEKSEGAEGARQLLDSISLDEPKLHSDAKSSGKSFIFDHDDFLLSGGNDSTGEVGSPIIIKTGIYEGKKRRPG